jgi:SAM-dependent methyltransferase
MRQEEFEVLYNLESKYWWFLGRTKIAFDMLKRHVKKQELKILDAGCGTGKNIEYLQKYGEVSGVDFSEDALSFCKERGLTNVRQGEIETLPYGDNTFDLVTCFGVLYHKGIKDDLRAIRELSRVCKQGGYVLITTPAGEFLMNPLLYSKHDKSQHTGRRHSKKRLRRLMKKSGLSVKEVNYMNTFLMPLIIAVRIWKNLFGSSEFKSELQMPSSFVNKILLNVLLFENKIIKFLPFGLTVVGIGRKK